MMECKKCEIIYHDDEKMKCELCGGELEKERNIFRIEAKGW